MLLMERYRFHSDGALFYVTFRVVDWLPIFVLHQNPVRKGLVREAAHWRFSSASYWASGGKTDNDVLLSAIVW
jgi:hypothetical protein